MSAEAVRHAAARELPRAWDGLCGSLFQKRSFLEHCERFNPCRQRYHLLLEEGRPTAGAIVYSLPVDLLSFLRIRSPLGMQIVGVPCSVSASGLIGRPEAQSRLLSVLRRQEAGLVIVLNLPEPMSIPHYAKGRTWPSMVLESRWEGFDGYLASLRSDYRRRLLRLLSWMESLEIETGPCSRYSESHHRMYEAVHARSDAKLERLDREFFRNLPDPFRLTTFAREARALGWVITVLDGGTFRFFLGGQTYDDEPRMLYLSQLVAVARMGIEAGARLIDLGQTAMVPKSRMGAKPVELVMLGTHPSPVLNPLLRAASGLLSYRGRPPEAHVFRRGAA